MKHEVVFHIKGVFKMSIIVSLFIFVYLAAIVLASILSIVWVVSLFVPAWKTRTSGA